MSIDTQVLLDSAESTIGILENIAGFEPSDIDGDAVELRFETEDGFDTGCDVSIVDQCQKAADLIRALLDELEAAEKRIAELEAREVVLPKPISVLHRRDFIDSHRSINAYPEAEVNAELAAAGITVKGE